MKFVDLFCGMGTIRMGFEQAGWECVYSVEWDKHKRRIYEVIFGKEPEGCDIRELRGADIPRAECWTFGAPCQDFSIAGKREGMAGERSSLVREVFRLVREKAEEDRPQWLLYENVKGMLSSNRGLDFLGIVLEMESLGYDVEWQLLNSKDFGVPQNRERVFTIGNLRKFGRREVFFEKTPNKTPIELQRNKKVKVYDFYNKTIKYNISNTITEHASRTDRSATNVIEIDTSCNQDKLESNRIRRLTPRECMRLQGVPDKITDKLIAEKISDTQMYRAAGDATTVNVLYEIGKRLAYTVAIKANIIK